MGTGVLVGVAAVLVGAVVAVGKDVALGTGVGVGADAGAQADNIRLTSKNTINVRFILRVLLWRRCRPTARASAAAASGEHSEPRSGCRLEAGVRRRLIPPDTPVLPSSPSSVAPATTSRPAVK